jgi:D-glycero-D-manno-heptose 1,7-bisphosphate phosphatase
LDGQNRPVARNSESDIPVAVLFDRDGTLVHDVPYNADPALVRPVDGARAVLDDLRARGVRIGVVSNQSGIGRGLFTHRELDRVNARVEELLGPIGTWQVCPHRESDGCACRKPAPGLVLAACAALDVPPHRTTVIGDIESDVLAALAAGADAVLVPTPATRPDEVERAPRKASDLRAAVRLAVGP